MKVIVNNYRNLIFVITCAFIGALYLYHFTDIPPIREDDAWFMEMSRNFADRYLLASPMLDNGNQQSFFLHYHLPFYYVCLGLIYKIFGFGILQSRLFTIFLAAASGFVFVKLMDVINVRRKINISIVVLLLFTTPLYFVMAKTSRPEMLLVLLSLLSVYLLLLWKKSQRNIILIFGAVVTSLACMTSIYPFHLLLPWAYILIRRKKIVSVVIFIVTVAVCLLPYILWIYDNYQIFDQQIHSLRRMYSDGVIGKLVTIVKNLFLSIKSIFITIVFIVGSFLYLKRCRVNSDSDSFVILLIPCVFILQFLVLPKFNILYVVAVIPFVYVLCLSSIDDANYRYLVAFLVVIIMINLSGVTYMVYKYRDYSYAAYSKQLLDVFPSLSSKTKILGRISMYPIFSNVSFKAYEAFLFDESGRSRNDKLLDAINNSDYVIVDSYEMGSRRDGMDNVNLLVSSEIADYIDSKGKLISSVHNDQYGSEGKLAHNVIKIYANNH